MVEPSDPRLVSRAVLDSVSLLVRRIRQTPVEDELSMPERTALARLERHGPATSADLARREQISPQSMGATVGSLLRRGLVRRSADPQDGRRAVLSLTPAGRRLLQDKRDARVERLAAGLAELNRAELARLHAAAELLHRLAERI